MLMPPSGLLLMVRGNTSSGEPSVPLPFAAVHPKWHPKLFYDCRIVFHYHYGQHSPSWDWAAHMIIRDYKNKEKGWREKEIRRSQVEGGEGGREGQTPFTFPRVELPHCFLLPLHQHCSQGICGPYPLNGRTVAGHWLVRNLV